MSINAILHDDDDDMKFDGIDDNDMITMWSLMGLMMKMWRQCNGDVKFDGIDEVLMMMIWNLMGLMIMTW